MAKGRVGKTVESLGDYLKEQRTSAHLSVRQLAEQAGVSNPYLSQLERGLHQPSVRVLKAVAVDRDPIYGFGRINVAKGLGF